LIMDKCRVAPWGVYEIKDASAYKQLKAIQKKEKWNGNDYRKAVQLQSKALEPAKNPGKWGELIQSPNDRQSWNDLIAYGVGYDCLLGNSYTWANLLTAGANRGTPQELWLMPAQHMNIWSTDTFPTRVVKYTVSRWPGVDYKPVEVLHEAEWNPAWEINGSQLYGVAPLRAALGVLHRNNSSMTASASAMDNQGTKGILSMGVKPGDIDGELLITEVDTLKQTMLNEWSGTENRGRIGLSAYDVKFIPIGLTNEEMQIIESEKWDMRRLANIWRVSSRMLNDPDNTAEANVEEAEKALTTRAALPRLIKKREAINRKAHNDWGLAKNLVIDFEMSAYSELGDDVKDIVDWTGKMVATIPNEQREQAGLAAIDHPLLNEPWVIQGGNRIPLSEFEATPIDQDLENDFEEDIS
jgi:phage portal protein BeeE